MDQNELIEKITKEVMKRLHAETQPAGNGSGSTANRRQCSPDSG